jgi:single-strand DNA-binding protein
MASYNRVVLVGNLTRDVQLAYLPSQTPVAQFGLAVNRKWKSKGGEDREEGFFGDCKAFGKSAETLNAYVKKGSQLLVEGRLTTESWETKDGDKRSKTVIVVDNFQFLASKSDSRPAQEPSAPHQAEGFGGGGDEIPF